MSEERLHKYISDATRIAKKYSYGEWEDVRQELLIKLWQAPDGQSPGFYYTVMKNRAIDLFRQEHRRSSRLVVLEEFENAPVLQISGKRERPIDTERELAKEEEQDEILAVWPDQVDDLNEDGSFKYQDIDLERAVKELLTPEDQRILGLKMAGYNNVEIGAEVGLAEATIRRRLATITDKLKKKLRVD